jgi:hypothetical protein
VTGDEFTDDFGNTVTGGRYKAQRTYWRLGYFLTSGSDRIEREIVDFNAVPPEHHEIHERLEGWAKWCRATRREPAAPMFRQHRSDEWEKYEYGAVTATPINREDAQRVAKGVALLPEKHRKAVQWCYLSGKKPVSVARELAVSVRGLADLVHDARLMLINRRV